jgi:hypothetical protein
MSREKDQRRKPERQSNDAKPKWRILLDRYNFGNGGSLLHNDSMKILSDPAHIQDWKRSSAKIVNSSSNGESIECRELAI